jgi:hypothetical protein
MIWPIYGGYLASARIFPLAQTVMLPPLKFFENPKQELDENIY